MKKFFAPSFASLLLLLWMGCGDSRTTPATSTPASTSGAAQETPAAAADPMGLMDLVVETPANKETRDAYLDAAKAEFAKSHGLKDVVFKPTFFKSKDMHAFLEAEVSLPDGSPYPTKEYEDCCGVWALIQMAASQIVVLQAEAFPTDTGYLCLWKEFGVSKEVFPHVEEGCE